MNRATSYYESNLVEKFKKNISNYILIPSGLTKYVQPLDISINGPMKKRLIFWDTEFLINHLNSKKPNENDLIETIYSKWYDNKEITKDNIINSFKTTGISSNLKGKENHLINLHSELADYIYSPDDLIEEDNKIISQ